ncbi:polyprenyl synthetase family protein [Stigmatella aurantiaca]|uniref:IdsA n=1 Tax=Stigmatella aurantiaca (strain DW4/3-1) TaxID=378806 RepID=Q090W4_STIAD|nr:polyprenyl synthetase family protein [Stigmatella aurantiaca]ADO75697.1 Polyprenyl synthetase [Stigmatella aurantiaca DW4/3-1]EAU66240.1 IdsA [Stigmatella aurantiaca DW4/3-1]
MTDTPRVRELLTGYLEECRLQVIQEIQRLIPPDRPAAFLYELMLDYPLREAKGLRPALCIAACRASGGTLEAALRPAVALELYHNAFLIHDDIEDESHLRRGRPTLHQLHGVPVAINVGDAMLALSLQPLLDNIGFIGLGPSLRILQEVARMARESAEGQALELDWIRRGHWALEDADYVRMVEQKTCWYSFITPVTLGALAARQNPAHTAQLAEFARCLGIAFQIQDDLLNLSGEVGAYGKEIGGDLWEGKRTLMLLHMMRRASPPERAEAERILSLPRPGANPELRGPALEPVLEQLVARGQLTPEGLAHLRHVMAEAMPSKKEKTPEQVRFLLKLLHRHGSLDHARQVAQGWLEQARRAFDACTGWLLPSVHRDLLEVLLTYVVERGK